MLRGQGDQLVSSSSRGPPASVHCSTRVRASRTALVVLPLALQVLHLRGRIWLSQALQQTNEPLKQIHSRALFTYLFIRVPSHRQLNVCFSHHVESVFLSVYPRALLLTAGIVRGHNTTRACACAKVHVHADSQRQSKLKWTVAPLWQHRGQRI